MRSVLTAILVRFVQLGSLTVEWPEGGRSAFGDGRGPRAAIRLTNKSAVWRVAFNPSLAVGEAYMDGSLIPVGCTVRDVLEVLIANLTAGFVHPGQRIHAHLRRPIRWLLQLNGLARSRSNVAHHYDLNGQLYRLILDRDMQYSCAYFTESNESLDEAQLAKKRHIAAKLLLDRPGLRVLDIGCGWGGMAMTLAREYGAHVTGITLSQEQLAAARARAEQEGLSDRACFELCDYRAVQGTFDRIVSVGMFEHVGLPQYSNFFATIARLLAPDGVALLHSIGNSGPPSLTNPWLTKYIFPGGYSPSLSEVFPPLERAGLMATDVEVLRLHYARTLQCWQQRFTARRAAIAAMYDERFCRMFEFYLAGCELAFLYGGEMVFQIQLTRKVDATPITRTYMLDERGVELADTKQPSRAVA